MLYKVGPPSISSGCNGELSCDAMQHEPAEDAGAFSMPMLASILRTAVEIGAVTGSGFGSDGGSGCSSDSSRAPFAGHRALAHPEPEPELEPEVCSHRRERRNSSLDLSLLDLSEGAWVRQMNWAVMQPYWRHQRTGETQWDEVPEQLSLQARAHLFRKRRKAGTTGRGDAYGRRGGTLPLQRAIAKHNSTANARSRPMAMRVA